MEVNGMLVTILMLMLFFGVVKAGLKLAWGTTKFVFGLGLFWLCPLLFVLIVLVVFHSLKFLFLWNDTQQTDQTLFCDKLSESLLDDFVHEDTCGD